MMIKVIGAAPPSFYNEGHQPQTRYYKPQELTKTKIKQDFGLILDKEIKKLNFEKFI